MVRRTDKSKGVLRSLDWVTIILYLFLLVGGWASVCGASYSFDNPDIFSLSTRSGMQIVWIGTSIVLGFVLLMLDDRYYETFAFIIFGILLILLFATIFNPHSIKGSRSWLVLGPLRLQPAEFAKFATALALAKFMSSYGYNIHKWRDFAFTLGIIFLPMIFIVLQHETGSALVYTAFFLMLCNGCVAANSVIASSEIMQRASPDNKMMATALWGAFFYGGNGISRLAAGWCSSRIELNQASLLAAGIITGAGLVLLRLLRSSRAESGR